MKRHVDDAAFGRIADAEGERTAVFADLVGGESGHCLEYVAAGRAIAVGVDDEAVLTFEFASEDLEQHDLERVEQFPMTVGVCVCYRGFVRG